MATDQQMTPSTNSLTRWSEPQLGEKLVRRIEAWDFSDARSLSPSETAEIRAAIEVYHRAPRTTSDTVMNAMMAKLAIGYPGQRVSDREADARLELYTEQLSDIPPDVLGMAFREAVRTIKFFPSIAEIRAIASKLPNPRLEREWFLQELLRRHAEPEEVREPNVSPEERLAIKAEAGLSEETSALLDRIVGSKAA